MDFHQPDCNECLYKEQPILIVGSRRFSAEILASFINANTPAKWQIIEQLSEVPSPVSKSQGAWRLIFIDCLGLSNADLLTMLKKEGTIYLPHDIVALFNLTRENTEFSQLIDLGVRGFFFENDQADYILKGICALKNGELWVTRNALMEYVSKQRRKIPGEQQVVEELTPREREVLLLLGSGATNEDISAQLFISSHTVKTHIYKIFKKLGVKNRLQAALWAANQK